MEVTLGGNRLGAGKKNTVDMKNYGRSTHDLGYIWRSSMAAGTLVPFMSEVGLPGDSFEINLDVDVKTHPTVGPLFGSFKSQTDIFVIPIRLYQGKLQNNAIGIGMNMKSVKLPQIILEADDVKFGSEIDVDNQQINSSCILSYLGIRGLGKKELPGQTLTRVFGATPLLGYWDIYKNYYANKQEERGAVIHSLRPKVTEDIGQMSLWYSMNIQPTEVKVPKEGTGTIGNSIAQGLEGRAYRTTSGSNPQMSSIMFQTSRGDIPATDIWQYREYTTNYTRFYGLINGNNGVVIYSWRYVLPTDALIEKPQVVFFPLSNIDDMRESLMQWVKQPQAYRISATDPAPYGYVLGKENGNWSKLSSQEGLGLKTYQSDMFNNWLNSETITGNNGINEITSVDTSDGYFTLDTLNLSKKVYDMLNRIAVTGGSYDDWLDAVYTHDRMKMATSPIYMGGLSRELVFQEVVSQAESVDSVQPLGTLAGKGVMSQKKKGGRVTIKIDEPSYIMGITSLTPRVDYSQGNKWDVNIETLDDFHKPALDEIGFQDLITDQMAWWDTTCNRDGTLGFKSAGKQPAWLNYMTNVNQVRGNFAVQDNEMFMTLNRRYEQTEHSKGIVDLTTYIDPAKNNYIFAQTSRDAQNFWVQISVGITARRKMSAKVMPNL